MVRLFPVLLPKHVPHGVLVSHLLHLSKAGEAGAGAVGDAKRLVRSRHAETKLRAVAQCVDDGLLLITLLNAPIEAPDLETLNDFR